jgi:hypothetical protein
MTINFAPLCAPMYRISRNGQVPIIDVDTIEDIEPTIRDLKAGRHDADESSAEPLPSGRNLRRWGLLVERRDAAVFLEPKPW